VDDCEQSSTIAAHVDIDTEKAMKKTNYVVNFGPQHPAAHGVLRLLLLMEGEKVKKADPHIGLLHRGTEKLLETKSWEQGIPYMDRLDYMSMMVQEHALSMAIETLTGKYPVSRRARYIRVVLSEVTRLMNHMLAVAANAMDVGAISPFLWLFEEREKLMSIYEKVSGARLHANYIIPGGVQRDMSEEVQKELYTSVSKLKEVLDRVEETLTENRIWRQRQEGIGVVTSKEAMEQGFTGVMLRASGVKWDVRKNIPYEVYPEIEFEVPIGTKGDCYDRYKLRMEEMRQSIKIIRQGLNKMPRGRIKQEKSRSMEELINSFLNVVEGKKGTKTSVYVAVEAPKGEFGIMLRGGEESKPSQCRIRVPGFAHLQGAKRLLEGRLLADVVGILGNLDLVFGEIDR